MGGWLVKVVSQAKYEKLYKKLLKFYGMKIEQELSYIDSSANFDNYDYSYITIGKNMTVSREVLFLCHDFSVSQALQTIGHENGGYFLREIKVGDNCFIGARATLLSGTTIGNNTIVGAGAIVKGNVPEKSIAIGNLAKVIGNTIEWGLKHAELLDYVQVCSMN